MARTTKYARSHDGKAGSSVCAFAARAIRPDNESPGGRSNKIEWVAGNQSECLVPCGVEHSNVVRTDDLRRDDLISIFPVVSDHADCVVLANKPQRTKNRVSMAGDADVSAFSGQSRSGYVSRAKEPSRNNISNIECFGLHSV